MAKSSFSSAARSLDGGGVPIGQRGADAERIQQLQLHAAGRVQRVADVALERFEPAGRPRRRVALLRAQRQPRADREDLGTEAEQRARVVGARTRGLLDLPLPVEDVDLVDDDDDLLAPAAHLLEKRALGFGERAVGGGHEQHQIRSRHELGGDRLVLADDRVGARRIDDVNLAEDFGAGAVMTCRLASRTCRSSVSPYWSTLICAVVGVTPSCGDLAADERVDEGALAGVELADDDEQEQLVELLDRAVERLLVLGRGIEARQRGAQSREDAALLADQLILGAGQNPASASLAIECRIAASIARVWGLRLQDLRLQAYPHDSRSVVPMPNPLVGTRSQRVRRSEDPIPDP